MLQNEGQIAFVTGAGGGIGRAIIAALSPLLPQGAQLLCVGTNAMATAAMLKAGAKRAATGENPVVLACRRADVIVGPIGIVIADSMLGEVTPRMAVAVGQADAVRILIPMNRCENLVAGVPEQPTAALLADVVAQLETLQK